MKNEIKKFLIFASRKHVGFQIRAEQIAILTLLFSLRRGGGKTLLIDLLYAFEHSQRGR